jgi:hypothetical protein
MTEFSSTFVHVGPCSSSLKDNKCFCQAKIAAFDHQKSRQWGEKGKRVIVENRGSEGRCREGKKK